MGRIMVFGRPGSGKATFSKDLHSQTSIPLYHLDSLFFLDNWQQRDFSEFLAIQKDICKRDSWIIDGNSTRSLAIRYARAHICIYFNFNKFLCLYRIFKRLFTKGEIVRWRLITYMWHFEQRVSQPISDLRKAYPDVVFFEVKNSYDLKKVTEEFFLFLSSKEL